MFLLFIGHRRKRHIFALLKLRNQTVRPNGTSLKDVKALKNDEKEKVASGFMPAYRIRSSRMHQQRRGTSKQQG